MLVRHQTEDRVLPRGAEWVEGVGRNADLYVLAWHDRYDDPDQRDEGQWIYYVVATTKLPDSQRVGRAGLDELVREEGARCVGASDLRGAVDAVALEVLTRRRERAGLAAFGVVVVALTTRQRIGLITRRSLVQIQPPPPTNE